MISKISTLMGELSYILAQKAGKKGSALPGKVAMKIKPDVLDDLIVKCDKTAIITGTNGKTTTNNLANHVFSGNNNEVISNLNGSNMLQGVISPFLIDKKNKYDWGIFEVDEGSMCDVTQFIDADYIILTNFFRDQLDRYGEVENTIQIVHDSIKNENATLILNADSPSSLYFSDLKNKKVYYSLGETKFAKEEQTVAESVVCPKCESKLEYEYINYGNMGKFSCPNCGIKNPEADYIITDVTLKAESYDFTVKDKKESAEIDLHLLGIYNLYNALGVITLARENNFSYDLIKKQIENFEYKLGRMETIDLGFTEVVLVLSKNPIGLSEVFSTINYDKSKKSLMFIMNDYSPDGTDVSWIWDAYFKEAVNIKNVDNFYCVGTRAEEVAMRLKYEEFPIDKIKIYHSQNRFDLQLPNHDFLNEDNDKKYLIATFTALPEVRKELMRMKEGK
ncbi:MurT ligase domain-containing protein [Methanobrevibacter sp. DSM 116169]|uniref:MurT ligase domain-containing protein n=1 Tax=Methanobrevibacter sp. DSM 116169 TaxID=3242727 RepID=UPI0038FD215F